MSSTEGASRPVVTFHDEDSCSAPAAAAAGSAASSGPRSPSEVHPQSVELASLDSSKDEKPSLLAYEGGNPAFARSGRQIAVATGADGKMVFRMSAALAKEMEMFDTNKDGGTLRQRTGFTEHEDMTSGMPDSISDEWYVVWNGVVGLDLFVLQTSMARNW
jgi:hypothetical protein